MAPVNLELSVPPENHSLNKVLGFFLKELTKEQFTICYFIRSGRFKGDSDNIFSNSALTEKIISDSGHGGDTADGALS